MGDHRMSVKISASFHGVEKTCNMWINYFPGECDGVDDRVLNFFRDLYSKGIEKYEEIIAAQDSKEGAAAQTNNTQRVAAMCEISQWTVDHKIDSLSVADVVELMDRLNAAGIKEFSR